MATKIVRDRIREAEGFVPCSSDSFRPVRDRTEHETLLLKKILEELSELVEAHELGLNTDIIAEGCDVVEVAVTFLMVRTGIQWPQIESYISAKVAAKGDFTGGLVWEHP
jgi:phosphoribosyl-ATP pyrophosphohydrolase